MKTDAEWEARALELAIQPSMSGLYGIHHTKPWMGVDAALQLGREMAQEARAEVYADMGAAESRWRAMLDEARREGQQAADARAEEIARKISSIQCAERSDHGEYLRLQESMRDQCAQIARLTITKPKTREQVLEEALRKIEPSGLWGPIARRALEWKP